MSSTGSTERLPKRARLKVNGMIDAETDALDRLNTTISRVSGLFKALRLKGADADPADNSLAEVEEETARLQAIQAQQQRRHVELTNSNMKVRRFLMELPAHFALEDVPREKVRPRKGESMLDAIKRVRLEISSAQSEVRKLHHAGPRAADLKRAARAYVSGLAEKGRPKITATHEKFEIEFSTGQFTLAPNVRAILAWLDPAALLGRLEDEIDALPAPALALSLKEKTERLAVAKAKLLVLEREEEALIEAAFDDGQHIVRRFDADPQAIIGVQVKRKKAVAA